ncbi:transposase [Streptomyces bobili]
MTERYQRRTPLLHRLLAAIGIVLSGLPGARLAALLPAPVSRTTMLRLLEGEPTDHLGHEPGERAEGGRENYRNGHRSKTVITESRPVEIAVPRDRAGSFEPQLVKKRQRRLGGVDEIVLSLSAKGLTHGEISPRLTPGDDTATVPSRQLRDLLQRLIAAGQWQTGDPDILIVAAAGYDAPCLGLLLKDLPVQVLARMRSDRVLRRPVPAWLPHTQGRPPRHCGKFAFGQPDTWDTPDTETDTRLRGTATARSWDRLHPELTHRSSRATADGTLPHRRRDGDPPGHRPPAQRSNTEACLAVVVRHRRHCGRRRPALAGHTCDASTSSTPSASSKDLGWTSPKIRTPEAADRWTWLILAAYTQLRLTRPLAADRRRPNYRRWSPPTRDGDAAQETAWCRT